MRFGFVKWFLVSVAVLMLSACGGGSGTSAQDTAIAQIKAYAQNGGTPPEADVYSTAGVTGVDASNIEDINAVVAGLTASDVETPAKIQALVNALGGGVVLPPDTAAPVITITGDNPMTITQGTTYTDLGATATDDRDGAVTVTTTDSVDADVVGTYTITYRASDTAGNTAEANRTVIVEAVIREVKKTGQTKSYNKAGDEVTDGSIKDDGFYQKGVTLSYTRDDATNIVTDHITGLEWQDDTAAGTVTKPWVTQANYDAGNYSDTSGDTATTYCATLPLDGGGWRLPTVVELQSIVVDGAYNPSIDTTAIVPWTTIGVPLRVLATPTVRGSSISTVVTHAAAVSPITTMCVV